MGARIQLECMRADGNNVPVGRQRAASHLPARVQSICCAVELACHVPRLRLQLARQALIRDASILVDQFGEDLLKKGAFSGWRRHEGYEQRQFERVEVQEEVGVEGRTQTSRAGSAHAYGARLP